MLGGFASNHAFENVASELKVEAEFLGRRSSNAKLLAQSGSCEPFASRCAGQSVSYMRNTTVQSVR